MSKTSRHSRSKVTHPTKRAGRPSSSVRRTPSDPAAQPSERAPVLSAARRPGYELREDEVEQALRSGAHSGLLEEYFGEAAYRELRELALESSTTRRRGGPRVLILPGIMGSTLGIHNRLGPFDDVVWLDPLDIGLGHMSWLAPDSGRRLSPLGVILFTYLRLRLVLESAGYDAEFYPFDWRRSIDELGSELADFISEAPQSKIHLVTHSMGGLVARAALKLAAGKKVERLVQLGTPNHGSFIPVQALRGTATVARAIAAIDPSHSPTQLAQEVFSKLPGLYQMLPSPERFGTVDLYARAGWPKTGPQPDFDLLRQVARARQALADADERFTLIAGVNQDTVTGLALGNSEFVYECSRDGDGTVPLDFALLPGARTYTIEEEHGALPNNGRICAAVVDLLSTGQTQRLEELRRRTARPVSTRRVTDKDLANRPPYEGRRGGELSANEVRRIASEFVAPDAREKVVVTSGNSGLGTALAESISVNADVSFQGVVIGRRRQRQLQIRLAHGSILAVRARVYVTGIFKGVEPGGPAAAIDAALDGTLKEFTNRRMFSANAGELFTVPTTSHLIHADTVVLAGLGSFDQFGTETIQLVSEHVARSLVLTRVDDFATVLFGVGSGHTVSASLHSYLVGLLRGLADSDGVLMHRVTLCETDSERFKQMKQELLRLSSTRLFEDIQLTLDEVEVPAAAEPAAPTRATLHVEQTLAYLHVRREPGITASQAFRSTILTAGTKATVISGVKEVPEGALAKALAPIADETLSFRNLEQFGATLSELVLSHEVRAVLDNLRHCHLVVVHDAAASRIPWETLCIRTSAQAESFFPAKEAGLSRRYIADNMSVSKWLEERRQDRILRLLLVTNPTEDLPGADAESIRIKRLFERQRDVSITELSRVQATKPAVLAAFRSGQFDVLHYAGHAFFDAKTPALSGVLCHGEQVLSGSELANLARLPSLVFFNACEAARLSGRARQRSEESDPGTRPSAERRIERNVGLAEAFLRGGVPNYIGTYWPVSDGAAEVFSPTLYRALIDGQTIAAALCQARLAVFKQQNHDWADYVLYGNSDFRLKVPR